MHILLSAAYFNECISGRCALHWAVEYDRSDLLDIMLRAGASKTILDEELKEPLDIAVELSNIKCISIILRSCSKEVMKVCRNFYSHQFMKPLCV